MTSHQPVCAEKASANKSFSVDRSHGKPRTRGKEIAYRFVLGGDPQLVYLYEPAGERLELRNIIYGKRIFLQLAIDILNSIFQQQLDITMHGIGQGKIHRA